MLTAEPDLRLNLMTMRSEPKPKSRVRCLTDWATQVPLYILIKRRKEEVLGMHSLITTLYHLHFWGHDKNKELKVFTCNRLYPFKLYSLWCLGGSFGWASDYWFQLRSWCQGRGIKPHVRLCTEHGVCLGSSPSLSCSALFTRSLSLK